MSLNRKILSLLREKRITKAQLAKAAGIPYTTLDSMLKRESDSQRLVSFYKIAEYLGVTMEELVFERNERLGASALTPAEQTMLESFRKLDRRGRASVLSLLNFELSAKEIREKKTLRPLRQIPIYDSPAAAGAALPLTSDEFSMVSKANVPEGASFGIKISGDSMEPLIQDGQIVWVRRQETLSENDIGVFLLNSESLCKRLYASGESCELRSENKKYEPIRVLESDDLRVIGKVIFG